MTEQVLTAAIAALSSGVALELVRRLFGRAQANDDDRTAFRRELVRENHRLVAQLNDTRQRLAEAQVQLAAGQERCQEAIALSQRLMARVKELEHGTNGGQRA